MHRNSLVCTGIHRYASESTGVCRSLPQCAMDFLTASSLVEGIQIRRMPRHTSGLGGTLADARDIVRDISRQGPLAGKKSFSMLSLALRRFAQTLKSDPKQQPSGMLIKFSVQEVFEYIVLNSLKCGVINQRCHSDFNLQKNIMHYKTLH